MTLGDGVKIMVLGGMFAIFIYAILPLILIIAIFIFVAKLFQKK